MNDLYLNKMEIRSVNLILGSYFYSKSSANIAWLIMVIFSDIVFS